MAFPSLFYLVFLFIKTQSNAENILRSITNDNIKYGLQANPYAHNNSNEYFSTKTSYFTVQNDDTAEIQIEGVYNTVSLP